MAENDRTIKLFGFEIKRTSTDDPKKKPSIVPARDDDGAGYVTAANAFPSGGIIIWSGAANAIPSGWYLCDGNNGTPDLRNRFIIGAGKDFD